jgi:hypothetical protein
MGRRSSPRPGARAPDGVRHGAQGVALPHDAPGELVLEAQQLLHLALEHLRHGDASPFRDYGRHVLVVDLFLDVLLPLFLQLGARLGHLALFGGDQPIVNLGRLAEIAAPRGALFFLPQLFEARLHVAHGEQQLLLAQPLGAHRVALPLQVGDLSPQLADARGARGVRLALQRLLFHLQLQELPLDLIDRGGHAVDLHAQLRGRLVDQVDGLVGQEALGDVAVRERGGGDQRAVLDADAVVHLVALLQSTQDGDGVLDRGLRHEHLLEAPLEGRVLLDALAILVERGRADAAQLAARQGRLQHVGRVHGALGRARADQRVDLVDEQDHAPLGALDLFQHGLEAILELAAKLGAGHHGRQIERAQRLVFQRLGHVAARDALGDALDHRRLAHAGLADEHGVVLGAARQHLNHAADLFVAPDHRVELAALREGGEILRVLLEGLKLPLRVTIGHALAAAHLTQRREQLVAREPGALEHALHVLVVLGRGEQHVLGRDEVVFQLFGLVFGLLQHREPAPRQPRLGAPRHTRQRLGLLGERAHERVDARPRLLHERRHDAPLLREQREQQVLGHELGVALAARQIDGVAHGLLCLVRESLESHGRLHLAPLRRRAARVGSSDARAARRPRLPAASATARPPRRPRATFVART